MRRTSPRVFDSIVNVSPIVAPTACPRSPRFRRAPGGSRVGSLPPLGPILSSPSRTSVSVPLLLL